MINSKMIAREILTLIVKIEEPKYHLFIDTKLDESYYDKPLDEFSERILKPYVALIAEHPVEKTKYYYEKDIPIRYKEDVFRESYNGYHLRTCIKQDGTLRIDLGFPE